MRKHARGMKTTSKARPRPRSRAVRSARSCSWRSSRCCAKGLETAVFLLAAFQGSRDPGRGRHRRDARCRRRGRHRYRDLPRRAASSTWRSSSASPASCSCSSPPGLVATAAHTAHEAGWLNIGQHQMLDLTWLVGPGIDPLRAAHGHARHPGRPVTDRSRRVPRVPDPDVVLRALAAPRPRRDAAVTGAEARVGRARRAASARAPRSARRRWSPSSRSSGCGSSGSKAGDGDSKVKTVEIELVKEGCSPSKLTLPAGPDQVRGENIDADAISEFEILDGKRSSARSRTSRPGSRKSFTSR